MKYNKYILISLVLVTISIYSGYYLVDNYLKTQEIQQLQIQQKFDDILISQRKSAKTIEDQEIKLKESEDKLKSIKEDSEKALVEQNKRIVIAEQKANKASNQKTTTNSISVAELQPYMTGVVNIICITPTGSSAGSGSIVNINGIVVMTNDHVVANAKGCAIKVGNNFYDLNINNTYEWNTSSDLTLLKLSSYRYDLNSKIGDLNNCNNKMPVGSPVVVIGFPMFARGSQTVTEGIISGYQPANTLPYSNYYVSAKMDSGNSGGIAFSKINGKLCNLGVGTWVSTGNFENIGIVQNIKNVIN